MEDHTILNVLSYLRQLASNNKVNFIDEINLTVRESLYFSEQDEEAALSVCHYKSLSRQ